MLSTCVLPCGDRQGVRRLPNSGWHQLCGVRIPGPGRYRCLTESCHSLTLTSISKIARIAFNLAQQPWVREAPRDAPNRELTNARVPASASEGQLSFNAPHPPTEKAIEAFNVVLHDIKIEILKSRNHWDLHEPKMWSRAAGLSDTELVAFTIETDLVECRSAPTSYGTIILGKVKLPAVQDAEGAGFVHVRYVPPGQNYV